MQEEKEIFCIMAERKDVSGKGKSERQNEEVRENLWTIFKMALIKPFLKTQFLRRLL